MSPPLLRITSRDNPMLQRLRRLLRQGSNYRREGQAWIEGEHLCSASVSRGAASMCRPVEALLSEDGAADPALLELSAAAAQRYVLPTALFKTISGLESPAQIGFVVVLPAPLPPAPGVPTVVLDRLQDAGNVGSILRSAAAFGFGQVLALKGTAALWSPKVLRAGMGAHFGLRLVEDLRADSLAAICLPMVATSSHGGEALHLAPLPHPCAWVLGHEGQGLDAALARQCALQVRIPQPGGEESLNVAAAAAVCLYESARRLQ